MKRRCKFSDQAIADLEDITDYIARDNPARAHSFVRELRAEAQRLGAFPEMGTVRPDFGPEIRMTTYRRYLILYRIQEDAVLIERIGRGGRIFI